MGRRTPRSQRRQTQSVTAFKPSIPSKPAPTLLTLPGELRNKIYQHLLLSTHRGPADTTSLPLPTAALHPLPTVHPALAQTNRLLRHELLSLLYGSRTYIISPSLGLSNAIPDWAKAMRSSLWYLRSIRFELFTEFTAHDRSLENELCGRVVVTAWLVEEEEGEDGCSPTPSPSSPSTTISAISRSPRIAFSIHDGGGDTCTCKFSRCARDVSRGILGSRSDAPLIRFLRAWDLPSPPRRGDGFPVCGGCGGGNVMVSLRDIRRGV